MPCEPTVNSSPPTCTRSFPFVKMHTRVLAGSAGNLCTRPEIMVSAWKLIFCETWTVWLPVRYVEENARAKGNKMQLAYCPGSLVRYEKEHTLVSCVDPALAHFPV